MKQRDVRLFLWDITEITIHEDLAVLRREAAAILAELPPPEDGDVPA